MLVIWLIEASSGVSMQLPHGYIKIGPTNTIFWVYGIIGCNSLGVSRQDKLELARNVFRICKNCESSLDDILWPPEVRAGVRIYLVCEISDEGINDPELFHSLFHCYWDPSRFNRTPSFSIRPMHCNSDPGPFNQMPFFSYWTLTADPLELRVSKKYFKT